MYREFEVNTSYKYLREVINVLDDPILILGGWAVFFHVNKNFQERQGRPYLGSRDVDLGFHFKKEATLKELKNSPLAKAMQVLKEKLKFKPVSFRLLKEVHTETEEEIPEGKIIPAHFIFPMYIDLIVDAIPLKFKEVFHFQPIDEPLLQFAFEKKDFRIELKEFNKKLWLPRPELLLATKLSSVLQRDKEHKRIKDLCDIFALLWYADEDPKIIGTKALNFIQQKKIRKVARDLKMQDYEKVGAQVNHNPEEVKAVLNTLQETARKNI